MIQNIKNKDVIRYTKACEKLAQVIRDIQEYNPDAHIFCNMDGLELHGYHNDSDTGFHNADAVVSVYILKTDCGER